MADLDFSHHVAEIPRGEALPTPYRRQVSAERSNIPDIQNATNQYAANTNWMSSLGSAVATASSNKIAIKLGGELGKNPQGDLGLSLTDFDRQLEKSYETQAHSTLGIQAQKLISKANLELAAQPRINAGMIEKSQLQITQGLNKIFSLAPDSIKPDMEHQYAGVMISQNERLVDRMLSEQKTDRVDNLKLSSKLGAENLHSLGMNAVGLNKEGDSSPALSMLHSIYKSADSAASRKDITSVEANEIKDSARQSYLSGKYGRLAIDAEKNNKLPEFMKSLADKPPSDVQDKDHKAVYNNIKQTIDEQQELRAQDRQLKMAQFQVKLAEDPNAITGSDFAALQSQLTPLQGQKAKLDLIQALNKKKTESRQSDALIADWGNSELHARSDSKAQNMSFDTLVKKVVSNGNGAISNDQAEVQVANASGAPIPVFTKGLQNKLSSGNPQLMDSAAQQMHELYQMGGGHALSGLTDKDRTMFGAIETLRSSLDPTEAAREAVNKIYNQDPVMFKANQQKWADHLSTHTKDISPANYALSTFGYSADRFLNPSVAQVYGTDMLGKYATYYQLSGGDDKVAKEVTQRYIDENYGDTSINGGKNSTLHPLEKTLGYHSSDVVPFIQQDVVNQMNEHFNQIKEAYNRGETNEYWESQPLSKKVDYFSGTSYDPIKVTRHSKENGKTKSETFDVVVQGNAFDNWDLAVSSKSGLRPLYQVAPYLGIINYIPNKKKIDEEYLRSHS